VADRHLPGLAERLFGRAIAAANNTSSPQHHIGAILLATIFSAAVGLFFGIYRPTAPPACSRWKRCVTNKNERGYNGNTDSHGF